MYKLLLPAVALFAAQPAFAQSYDPLADEMVEALPAPEDVEAIAPVMDNAIGALLDVDVGPVIDAADPYRRRYDHGRPGRTLGEIGSRDDPYFHDRLRSSVYESTAEMGRMMGAFSAAAPALARTMREFERAIAVAVEDHDRRIGRRRYRD